MVWIAVLTFAFAQTSLIYATSNILTNQRIRAGRALVFGFLRMNKVAPTSFVLVLCLTILGAGLALILARIGLLLSDFVKDTALTRLHWWFSVVLFASLFGFVLVRVMLFNHVAAIERRDSLEALARSWRLLSGASDDGPWPRRYDARMLFLVALWAITSVGAFWVLEKIINSLVASSDSLLGTFQGGRMGAIALMGGAHCERLRLRSHNRVLL